jgi:MoxR-like ATPase
MSQDLSNLQQRITQTGYVADQSLITSLWLMNELQRPLLIEGDAGVGKTEIAKTLASINQCSLIRLQCYEGLDVNHAVYEWNYQRQLLAIQNHQASDQKDLTEKHLFGKEYLLERPLLQSITSEQTNVLLIDEVDRADEEFEAYLLEILSDFQISIPELGTLAAKKIPQVILTSNGTRELSDALRRRCLYHYLDYPSYEKELRIIHNKVPDVGAQLAAQIAEFLQQLRREDLRKRPGVAETLDWAAALLKLNIKKLDDDPELIFASLGCLLKTREDQDALPKDYLERMIRKAV